MPRPAPVIKQTFLLGVFLFVIVIPFDEGLNYLRRYAANNRVSCHIFRDDGISGDNRIFADGYAWHH